MHRASKIWLVSRHPGAQAWLRRRGLEGEWRAHLGPGEAGPGDCVIGTLPLHRVLELGRVGARYLHLEVEVPAHLRGQELDADQLDALGARLVPLRVLED